ncbi:YjbQ family protein [Inediibacterium massiliense]|uniref:YjbQ family protein n=1 Tax=Inediibacterium massiliense TaxID=1658111 RepID=UPI000AA15946|nr:YjbQ family protein [Inediibacterium massiliense]
MTAEIYYAIINDFINAMLLIEEIGQGKEPYMFKNTRSSEVFLLTYNPKIWNWRTIKEAIDSIEKTGACVTRWSCGTRKKFNEGARCYLIRLGGESKGIFAFGWVNNGAYKDIHWDENKEEEYKHFEGNSHVHLKSSYMGAEKMIIINKGKPILGTWQSVYFCEFDGPRNRNVWI